MKGNLKENPKFCIFCVILSHAWLSFHQIGIDTTFNLRYKLFMTKRILTISIVFAFLLSSCGEVLTNLSEVISSEAALPSPTPTITPTPQPQVRVTLGEKDILSGDYDAAYNEFMTSSNQSSDSEVVTAALLGMGRALLLKSDFRGAIDQFSYLLINYPSGESRDTAFFFLAKAYEALSQPRLAADAYASYLAALPGALDREILEMRGDALMQVSDPTAAKAVYEQALTTVTNANYDDLQIKLAQSTSAVGDDAGAISLFLALYDSSASNYTKAQVNLLLGQIYLRLAQPEQAYARFQDSVNNFPEYYDSYSGLVALVDAGQNVNPRQRGLVDYYAGQYAVAAKALDQYLLETTEHDGSAHYFKALSLYELGMYESEVAEWEHLIKDHATDEFYYPKAVVEKSQTQWAKLQQYESAAEACLIFVASVPSSPKAPFFLERAASIYEIGRYLTKAAETYERVFNEYPGSEEAYPGLFKAGILYYRLDDFLKSQITFQRLLVLAATPEEKAAANLWVAKSLEKQGKSEEARIYYQQAVNADPTGYYSIRATQILKGQTPFPGAVNIDLAVDYTTEKMGADRWMRDTFKLDPSIDLSAPAELTSNALFQRAEAHTKLGMREEARAEYESLRMELLGDALNTYRLMNRLLELGFYRSAALSSRQILDLAGFNEITTLAAAPKYFNHIRFGVFFRENVISTAVEHNLDPLLLFSIIRQESLFDSSIISSAGAKGLMQIMPATGAEIVKDFGWPANYRTVDLNRPVINVRLGAHYYKKWLDYFKGDHFSALASYNGGPGNTFAWTQLSDGDPDLLLEVIRSDETRDYIKKITEYHEIYKSFYTR
ncbi:MAG: hypothetical protein FD147_1222 [Chloroflexi bacterium]|nr:MAG: hypothetical protein FD147_1222 [Chloroflexota bacterium]MBA4374551.1 hypothetical protein [Anaerolinea sp.]